MDSYHGWNMTLSSADPEHGTNPVHNCLGESVYKRNMMENDVSINFSKEALEEIEFPRGAFMMSEQTASHTNTAQDMSFTSDPHVLGPTNVELVLLTSNVIDANHHSDLAVKHPWSLPSDAESTERTPFLSGHQTNHDNAIFQHDVSFQGDLSAMEDLQIPDNITVDHGPGNLTSLQRLNKGVSIDRTVPDSGPEFQQGVVNFHSDLYSFIGLQEVNSFNPTLQIEDVNVSQRHDQTSAFNAIDSDIVRIHHANQVHDASLVAEVHPIDNRGALRFTSIGLIPIPVARTKQFTRRIEKKGKNVVKHRHSLHNWNHVFETSNVFWKHMGYTSEEVAAILTVIYDFPISKSTLDKKLPKQSKRTKETASRRPAQALPKKQIVMADAVSKFLIKLRSRDTAPIVVPDLPFQRHIDQEEMFHALHGFINGSFDLKRGRWKISSFSNFEELDNHSRSWRLRDAHCRGIAAFAKASLYDRVDRSFRELLAGLRSSTQDCDPTMLIYFWPICQTLGEIRLCRRSRMEFILLRLFLTELRRQFSRVGRGHAFVQFLDALTRVLSNSPKHLRPSVGLAYWKTIHMLDGFLRPIAPDHPIILRMGSHCSNNWKTKFQPCMDKLETCYQEKLRIMETSTLSNLDESISTLLDYIEAVSKSVAHTKFAADLATLLWEQSRTLCREGVDRQNLHWTKAAEALAFSTDVLAKYHIEGGKTVTEHRNSGRGCWYMGEAIEILRRGDILCQVQAFSLTHRLEVLLKGNGKSAVAEAEKLRRFAILAQIPRTKISVHNSQTRAFIKDGGSGRNRLRRKKTAWREAFYASLLTL